MIHPRLAATAVVGLLSLVTMSLSNAARVQEYDRAAMLARAKMGEMLTAEPLRLGVSRGEFDAASGWEARVEPLELPANAAPGQVMLARIGLEIWWQSDGRRKSVEFESYRRLRIRPDQQISLSR